MGFAAAAYGEQFRAVFVWVEDQENSISRVLLDATFGEGAPDDGDQVDDLHKKDSQLHVALQALTEGESFQLVFVAEAERYGCLLQGSSELGSAQDHVVPDPNTILFEYGRTSPRWRTGNSSLAGMRRGRPTARRCRN
eukprot:8735685-Heterocapsa_arctica.AAC.1